MTKYKEEEAEEEGSEEEPEEDEEYSEEEGSEEEPEEDNEEGSEEEEEPKPYILKDTDELTLTGLQIKQFAEFNRRKLFKKDPFILYKNKKYYQIGCKTCNSPGQTWILYLRQGNFLIKCPFCGHIQELNIKNVKTDRNGV